MSITWGYSVRSHDGKQGASSAGATPPAALSAWHFIQNPLAPSSRDLSGRLGARSVHTEQVRPAYDWKAFGWYVFGIVTAAILVADVIIAWNIGKVISK